MIYRWKSKGIRDVGPATATLDSRVHGPMPPACPVVRYAGRPLPGGKRKAPRGKLAPKSDTSARTGFLNKSAILTRGGDATCSDFQRYN